jgi:electron transfer flavoprotein alpha subunit
MRTLVVLEQRGGSLQPDGLGLLERAAHLGDADAAILGSEARSLATLAGHHGATHVFTCQDPELAVPRPQPFVDVLAGILDGGEFDNVFLSQSVLTADIAAGLSARLGAGLNWSLVDVAREGDELFGTQHCLQDTVVATVGWVGTPRLALFRPGQFEPVAPDSTAACTQISVDASFEGFSTRAIVTGQADELQNDGVLTTAEVVIAGGRGLGSAAGFSLLEALAQSLGGVVGSTRAVVDAGWYPYETQIGQTGATVAPALYIAVGISGAIQHRVGMERSEKIIAINTDPAAPIFEYSDVAVIGDYQTILPALIASIGAA